MTPEQRALKIVDFVAMYCGGFASEIRAYLINDVATEIRAAVEAERAACMADMCDSCRDGNPMIANDNSAMYRHADGYLCRADRIRARTE